MFQKEHPLPHSRNRVAEGDFSFYKYNVRFYKEEFVLHSKRELINVLINDAGNT